MAKFLNTTATNFYLEEMVKNSRERLVLISPYLKLNDRLKEFLEDKNRLKLDIRLVYGKSDLRPAEAEWLSELSYVRTSFCRNLHAKCYLSEESCIISSLNLYEFSQVNNNEMGVLMEKEADPELYREAYEEAQRIIRISDEDAPLAISEPRTKPTAKPSASTPAGTAGGVSALPNNTAPKTPAQEAQPSGQATRTGTPQRLNGKAFEKLTVARLAKQLKITKATLEAALVAKGWMTLSDGKAALTDAGRAIGAEPKSGRYGDYILWPADIRLD